MEYEKLIIDRATSCLNSLEGKQVFGVIHVERESCLCLKSFQCHVNNYEKHIIINVPIQMYGPPRIKLTHKWQCEMITHNLFSSRPWMMLEIKYITHVTLPTYAFWIYSPDLFCFHYLSGVWAPSWLRDHTWSVYRRHAAGFNPNGVGGSCPRRVLCLQMTDVEHTGSRKPPLW